MPYRSRNRLKDTRFGDRTHDPGQLGREQWPIVTVIQDAVRPLSGRQTARSDGCDASARRTHPMRPSCATGRRRGLALMSTFANIATCLLSMALLLGSTGPAWSAKMPAGLTRLLPPGFTVLDSAAASFGRHGFTIVALGRQGEDKLPWPVQSAAARPLLVFESRPDGSFRKAGRNDSVVMRADGGGPCDPFLGGGRRIVVKARMFTVENGVACGPQHWTDAITFRFDDHRAQYVFDNERVESWSFNPSRDPNAEALVRDGPPRIDRGDPARPVPFDRWRPSR